MNEREITRMDLVEGGNVVRQGHHFTLGYQPRDVKGDAVDLTGKNIAVTFADRKGIVYETTATFTAGLVYVTVNENIGSGEMWVEFTVTSSTDANYRQKFPTNRNDGRLNIVRSTDDLDYYGVPQTTVTQLRSEQQVFEQTVDGKIVELEETVTAGIGAFTEDTEVINARQGKATLGENLNGITAQLADKASKQDLANMGSAAPKGTYETLVALQTAFPAGTTGIYIVTADGKWYYWNNSAWTAGGVYQSTGIADRSIRNKHLANVVIPRNMLSAGTYSTTYQDGNLAIYNEPLSINGNVDVTFLSGKISSGKIFILERDSLTNVFTVLKVLVVTTSVGENSIDTGYIAKADGKEYIGFYNVGLKVNLSGTTGVGRFEKAAYNGTDTPVTPTANLSQTWEFGYYVTFSNTAVSTELDKIRDSNSDVAKKMNDLGVVSHLLNPMLAASYPITYSDGVISIPNFPIMKQGDATVTFLSGKVANGFVYLLERVVNSNTFNVIQSVPVSTIVGKNKVVFDSLVKGDGTDFVGFFNVGLKANTAGNPGFTRFEKSPFNGTDTTIITTVPTSSWDYGFEIELLESTLGKKLSNLNTSFSKFKNSFKPLVAFDLLRFEKTAGNFSVSPNVYFFGRWFVKNYEGVDYVSSINQGAEIYAKIQNTTTVKAQFKNVSPVAGYVSVSVDGAPYVRHLVADEITIATGLSLGEHYISIVVSALNEGDTKWATGMGCNFKQLVVDVSGVVEPVKPHNRFGLYFGDSITEGISVLGAGGTVAVNSAEKAFPMVASKLLNSACIRIGHGATGITKSGNGGVPKLSEQIDFNYSGVKENAQRPDYIVLNHGTNDTAATAAVFKTGYIEVIEKIRLKYPGIYIFCMRPYNGSFGTQVAEVTALYKNTVYVDTTGWNPTTSDGTHLNEAGHLLAGTNLAEKIKEVFGTTYFFK